MKGYLLNPKVYKSGFFLLLLMFLLEFGAGGQVVYTQNDSIRQSLRLRSHLLVDPAGLASRQLDSLLQKQIPLAFRASGQMTGKLREMIALIAKSKLPVVVIAEENTLFQAKDVPGIFLITDDELDRMTVAADLEIETEKTFCKEFLCAEINSDSMPSAEPFIKLWEHTGRMPNFIQAKAGKLADAAQIVTTLNSHPKIFGVVRNNDQLLADVSWKDLPDRKTSGYFSFPVNDSVNTALAPYKPGYRFSPDIMLPSPENLHNLKVFNVLPLVREFGLTDQFRFSGKVKNLCRENDSEITRYGLSFVSDKERGGCAFFSGKAYLDGGLKSRMALKPNFTITAWIKPTELGNNNCILGKGKNFVLKIHRGQLTFTVQGVKDYYSPRTQIPVNQWSFISLVHSGAENQIRFYLNGELTDQVRLLTPYAASDYTMLIGSNLWEEFFKGYMSEIKIWERELNDEEIGAEFRNEKSPDFSLRVAWMAGIIVLLGALGFGFWVKPFRGKKEYLLPVSPEPLSAVLSEVETPVRMAGQINCFGGLKVIGADGSDVSKKFSPKLKQLFVLILLHSVGGQKGISSKEMSDVLWPGMSPQNAKNIRGTNIQNLKALLAPGSGIKLSFQDKLWFFEFAEGYFIDYTFVEACLSEPAPDDVDRLVNRVPGLLKILKRGTLFPNMGESWVDPYIDRMSNRILEFGVGLFQVLTAEKYDALLLEIAEVISINDPLNEPALRKKISILTRQGKLGLAHSVFENFGKLYFELYQEKYPADFKTLIAGEAVTTA